MTEMPSWILAIALAVGFIGISWAVLYRLPKKAWKHELDKTELRGLGLPRGSVRAMLALWIVGVYLLFLILIPAFALANRADLVNTVLTAFGPLVGAVAAFYFAARTAAPAPDDEKKNRAPSKQTKPTTSDAEETPSNSGFGAGANEGATSPEAQERGREQPDG